MSLATPAKLRRLQRALYATAKRDPARRFHVLYDKVWREDILAHAFALSRENGGAPGVDGVTLLEEIREVIDRPRIRRRHPRAARRTRPRESARRRSQSRRWSSCTRTTARG